MLKPWDATLGSPSLNAWPSECRSDPLPNVNVEGRNEGSKLSDIKKQFTSDNCIYLTSPLGWCELRSNESRPMGM